MPSHYYSSYTVTGTISAFPASTTLPFTIQYDWEWYYSNGTISDQTKNNTYAFYPNAVFNVPLGCTITEQLPSTCNHALDGTYSKASISASPSINVIGDSLGIGSIGIISDSSKHSVIYVNVVLPHWTSPANSTLYSIYAGLVNKITL